MLFAFIGQAFAYTSMSCEMSADAHQSHMATTQSRHHADMNPQPVMDHGNMEHSKMEHSGLLSHEDCCGVDCVCPASACSTATLVNAESAPFDLIPLSEDAIIALTRQTKSISTSLFRPPIFV